ncbi:MAG: serine/threonine protein kinase, partial [Planctomycetes bacterium]|nr:serine/threonine protein kinase [Planctomycetota bacterium]
MRDLDEELIQAALEGGFIDEADLERVEAVVANSKAKLYRAQVLVRERFLTTHELLTLQNRIGANLYTCPSCGARHKRSELPKERGEGGKCNSCGEEIRLQEAAGLSRIEVLVSQDPRDLSIPLKEHSGSASASVSEIDLDRYEVQDELGRGGYGVVFRATHRDLEREVALKILRKGTALPELAIERFLREGRSASRLRHPNIVSVYDIGRYRDLFAMTMEYVPGRPLKNVLREKRRYPATEAADLMREILDGVQHAHEQGVIHRDLKPTNIIIDEAGRPRLIDFGLAKDLQADTQLTGAGAIIGTPYYLSPEQIQGRSHQVDARSDVFALGVILYEVLAGRRPFTSNQKSEIYLQILKKAPKPLSERVEDLPPGLEAIVNKAIAKKPEDRYQSAEEFRQALVPFSSKGASTADSNAELAPTDAGSSETRRRKSRRLQGGKPAKKSTRRRPAAPAAKASGPPPAVLAAIGAGLLLLLVIGAVVVGSGDDEQLAQASPSQSPAVSVSPRSTRSRPPR